VLRLPLVLLVLLDMSLMNLADVIHVMLDLTLHQMGALVSLVLVVNTRMSELSFVHPVRVIVLLALQLLNVEVAILDMVIHWDHAHNALEELIQQAEPILANHAVLVCGQTQDLVFVQNVSILLVANFVLRQQLVPSVLLDIKEMDMEDVLHVLVEHILQLVDTVFLVLAVNGQILQVPAVQIV